MNMAENEFDLPLLLLRDMRPQIAEDLSKGSSTIRVGEGWRDQVAASVVAAFRDLRDNMHVRTSSSRAMEIGFQELVTSRYSGAGSPVHTQPKTTALRRMEFNGNNPTQLSGVLGRKAIDDSNESKALTPCLDSRTDVCGVATSFKNSASDSEIRSNHCDVQSDFLSAFTVLRPRGDSAEGASEASNSDGAEERRLQSSAEASVDPHSFLNGSSQRPVSKDVNGQSEQVPSETGFSFRPLADKVGSEPVVTKSSPSDGGQQSDQHAEVQHGAGADVTAGKSAVGVTHIKAQWVRNIFGRNCHHEDTRLRQSPPNSSSSLSGIRGSMTTAPSFDRANVPGVFPVSVRGSSGKEGQALSPIWCVREVETGDRAALWSVAVSPRGDWLAAAGQTGVVFLWAVPSIRPHSSGKAQLRRNFTNSSQAAPNPLSATEAAPSFDVDGNRTSIQNGAENDSLHTFAVNTQEINYKSQNASVQHESHAQTRSSNPCKKVLDSSAAAVIEASSSLASTSDVHTAVRGQMLVKPLQPWFIGDKPDMCLTGHGASVIFLSWAPSIKMSLLLSASLDRTVRLWRPSRQPQAIAVIRCTDWPTSASFHPIFKDVIFTGCLDATIQVWRLIPRKESDSPRSQNASFVGRRRHGSGLQFESRIVEYLKVTELVTAMSISPNGGVLAVGFRNGSIAFYDAKVSIVLRSGEVVNDRLRKTLKFRSEVDCKNRKGKFAKGRKVTSLEWLPDGSRLCVTTNDSRIRVFDISTLSCIFKYKGHANQQIMLRASFTPSLAGIVCGSEQGRICYWAVHGPTTTSFSQRNAVKRVTNAAVEDFKAFNELLTCAIVAPDSFAQSLCSYIAIHPLPHCGSRAPAAYKFKKASISMASSATSSQPCTRSDLPLLQQEQFRSGESVMRVFSDADRHTIRSISGGPVSALGTPAALTRRQRLLQILQRKKQDTTGPTQQDQKLPPCTPGICMGTHPTRDDRFHRESTSPPKAATGDEPSEKDLVPSPTQARTAEHLTQDCDSDDSDICAASLAALSVADWGGQSSRLREEGGRCWRAGKRLHLGLPPEPYALCTKPSEASRLVMVAGSYNGRLRLFINLAAFLTRRGKPPQEGAIGA